jgi:hypothetical protein
VRRYVAIALVLVAVAVAIWVGFSESHFWVESAGCPIPIRVVGGQWVGCVPPIRQPQFAVWRCALLGAGAAVVIVMIALAVVRWPKAIYSN